MAAIVIFFGDAIALMFAKKLGLQNWEVCVAGALLMVICKVLKPKVKCTLFTGHPVRRVHFALYD